MGFKSIKTIGSIHLLLAMPSRNQFQQLPKYSQQLPNYPPGSSNLISSLTVVPPNNSSSISPTSSLTILGFLADLPLFCSPIAI